MSKITRYGELSKDGRRQQRKAAREHLGASVTIHHAGLLSDAKRRECADWLRRMADEFLARGDRFTSGRWRGCWFV